MARGKLTAEMYSAIPAQIEQGMTKAEIAALCGVTVDTLQVQCSRRGISLRKGGKLKMRQTLALPDAVLPLSEAALIALRNKARALGKDAAKLATELLEIIANDDLYRAVLDLEAA